MIIICSGTLCSLQIVDGAGPGSWALWGYMTLAQVYKAIITGLCFTSVFICISNSAPNAKKVQLSMLSFVGPWFLEFFSTVSVNFAPEAKQMYLRSLLLMSASVADVKAPAMLLLLQSSYMYMV